MAPWKVILAGLACSLAGTGFAQPAFPAKAVRIVVPITAGSGVDIIARTLAAELAARWSQPVEVENRPGDGGVPGMTEVARAPADGYTLLANTSGFAVTAAMKKDLPYDPAHDFVAVAPLGSLQNVLLVSSKSGIDSVAQLISRAKDTPGKLSYGSAGTGTGVHLNGEKFRREARLDMSHLPAKGGPEALSDVESERVLYFFSPISIALPPIRDGRLKALAVSGSQRSPLLPDVPTVAEAALPAFRFVLWNGLWAPAGTPPEVVSRIARDVGAAFANPVVRTKLAALGIDPMQMSPAGFAAFVAAETRDYRAILQDPQAH